MQPNFQTTSYQTTTLSAARNKVLRNTYALLALSLVPTVIGAVIGTNMSFAFMAASPMMSTLLLLAVIYGLFFAIEKNKDSGVGVVLLLGLTFFMGVLLGPLLQVALRLANGPQLVVMAGGLTAVVFFVMAGIATTTKRDLSGLTKFLTVGAVVLMVAVIANVFLRLPALQLTLCAAFSIFSSLMILWQVKTIVDGGETNYVSATLTLYISIYNLFTSLLQLLMAFTGNDRN
ncbi:Bax inhibitor-1/YccA family protein [Crenobacter sp. SG2303]|uniref:Bax inhibitor-1/YccA family protein n=1 Tax=Crenobacter oryzisoli TaxID=3056844 RepID=A0ABT7XTV6_9NEIS|nr:MULTISPECIES: Bax inhibitor-1/YccA family protein [unclassified Crenobacter]MDN0077238.1 Bax inhibitor-1/YccA family protein [Crenobacter sp. SG2303]MDN0084743.1 Bax inhibitor-1/YccA family protein [Crenobacter sp. SG2305]